MTPEDRPEVEVLDTERPPGAVQQWVTATLRRPAGRAAAAVVAALVLVGVWATLPEDEPDAAAETDAVALAEAPPGLRPPPARGRAATTGSWQVADLAVRSGPRGHLVTFRATNGGGEAQDPSQLEVTGAFVDRPGLVYRATCSRAELTRRGYRAIEGTVRPTRTVLVRCTDVTRYGGRTAWIDPSSVTVRRIPCESEGSSLPM